MRLSTFLDAWTQEDLQNLQPAGRGSSGGYPVHIHEENNWSSPGYRSGPTAISKEGMDESDQRKLEPEGAQGQELFSASTVALLAIPGLTTTLLTSACLVTCQIL